MPPSARESLRSFRTAFATASRASLTRVLDSCRSSERRGRNSTPRRVLFIALNVGDDDDLYRNLREYDKLFERHGFTDVEARFADPKSTPIDCSLPLDTIFVLWDIDKPSVGAEIVVNDFLRCVRGTLPVILYGTLASARAETIDRGALQASVRKALTRLTDDLLQGTSISPNLYQAVVVEDALVGRKRLSRMLRWAAKRAHKASGQAPMLVEPAPQRSDDIDMTAGDASNEPSCISEQETETESSPPIKEEQLPQPAASEPPVLPDPPMICIGDAEEELAGAEADGIADQIRFAEKYLASARQVQWEFSPAEDNLVAELSTTLRLGELDANDEPAGGGGGTSDDDDATLIPFRFKLLRAVPASVVHAALRRLRQEGTS